MPALWVMQAFLGTSTEFYAVRMWSTQWQTQGRCLSLSLSLSLSRSWHVLCPLVVSHTQLTITQSSQTSAAPSSSKTIKHATDWDASCSKFINRPLNSRQKTCQRCSCYLSLSHQKTRECISIMLHQYHSNQYMEMFYDKPTTVVWPSGSNR